jgi:cell division protein FtsI/penicillin-binding protein 2
MVALRHILLSSLWMLVAIAAAADSAKTVPDRANSLFAQSAAQTLRRDFTDPNLSFLLLDAKSGTVIASRWENPETPIPMGSLVKPFTALAYGEQYGFDFPAFVCRGAANQCWRTQGHGRLTLETAIANSCNAYFKALAMKLSLQQITLTAARFNIEAPNAGASASALAGLGQQWQVSPLRLARAYVELLRRREEPGVREIIGGMALSARWGTGAAVGRALPERAALVKTGTASCTHAKHAPGDGFTVAMWPADDPRILLLVRVHSAPGAEAAAMAGKVLRRLGE